MGEIVNLNQYRKALRRQQEGHKSSENRVKFGRLKSERKAEDHKKNQQTRLLDLAKIENLPLPLPTNKTPGATPPLRPESPSKST